MKFNDLIFDINADGFDLQNLFFINNYGVTIERRSIYGSFEYTIYIMKKRDDSDNTFTVLEINDQILDLYSIIPNNQYITSSQQEVEDIINNVINL